MEMQYPIFTEDMKKTHTILIPNMAPVQFRILAAAMEYKGYKVELLGNCGSQVSELGLKYVHNDTCCLLYTSPSPRDRVISRMPSSA